MAREGSSGGHRHAGRVVERLLQVDRGIGFGDELQALGLHAGGLGAGPRTVTRTPTIRQSARDQS